MTVAAVLAVYGSHRIETLRQADVKVRRLGQYALKQRLGGGGMGEVYRADHLLLRRPCAIKLIRPDRAGDSAMLQRFEREVQATATLTHPNTVQIFDYGHTPDGTFYYVMEFLPGLTLEQLVSQQGPLPPGRAVHFLLQLCGALHEAHSIGLIHRDIKPGNVMVCERGRTHDVAKLLDFGLVQTHLTQDSDDQLTQQGTIVGTPAFLSPEQAGSGETVDARSDIYSLGALAYFLLTGQSMFAGRSPMKVLAAHLYESPASIRSFRADVPPDLDAVVIRCLAKNPQDRFSHIRALSEALADCGASEHWTEQEAAEWWRSRAGWAATMA
jgi:serine/threonine-protein kinase